MIRKYIRAALAGLAVLSALAALAGCDSMTSPGMSKKVLPDAPTNVSVTATSSSTLSVSWTGSSTATSYRIYYSTSSTYSSSATYTTATSSYCSLTGLYSATTYYVWVAGVNSYGMGSVSSVAYGKTDSGTTSTSKPSAPTGVSAYQDTGTSIYLSWYSVTGATGYEVYSGTTSTASTYLSSTTSTHMTITGFTSGTKYYFRVKAYNAYGTSGYSTYCSVTPYSY